MIRFTHLEEIGAFKSTLYVYQKVLISLQNSTIVFKIDISTLYIKIYLEKYKPNKSLMI